MPFKIDLFMLLLFFLFPPVTVVILIICLVNLFRDKPLGWDESKHCGGLCIDGVAIIGYEPHRSEETLAYPTGGFICHRCNDALKAWPVA